MRKITYTVSWTEQPENWNIPGAIKLLEIARAKAIAQEQKQLEELSLKETQLLIERVRKIQ
jgi:hypothetical protein